MSNTIVHHTPETFNTDAAQRPNMLAWALRYAELGYHVFPCHTPLFNHPKGYLCSCEAWRHTPACKAQDEERKAKGQTALYLEPHEHCANPGKHPRGSRKLENGKLVFGFPMATTDPAQIGEWWRKYSDAPIGWVPGMDDRAALDLDEYKKKYAGADLLTEDEQRTQTVRTGSGGRHLHYRKHDGATYANAPGDLPEGIDVRADNGYVILPPSLHYSGNRYQWEPGCNPAEIEPQLLPQHIHDVLVAASAKTARTSAKFNTPARWDGTPSTDAPDLAKWKLSVKVRGLIAHPAAKGGRSEADAKVVQSLVYAGAADDDILAVFEHHPIGTAGKFAEGGRRYLERTISAARAYAEEHPRPPDVSATIAKVRAWVHSIDFAEYVAEDKQCAAGYRTRETDLAVANAALQTFEEYGSLDGPLGLRQLRAMCNFGGTDTVKSALDRLTPWFIRPVERADDAGGANAAQWFELTCYAAENLSVDWTPPNTGNVIGVQSTHKIYQDYRHRDAFVSSATPITPDDIAKREASGKPYSTKYTLTEAYRRRIEAAVPAAGRTALVVVDALVDADGGLQMDALIGLGGRSVHAIRKAVGRLKKIGLVKVTKRFVQLADDWQAQIDTLEQLMPTHGVGRQRIARDAIRTLEACEAREQEAKDTGTAAPGWVEHRKTRATNVLKRLAPSIWRREFAEPTNAIELGHKRVQRNQLLLEEQLPELREMAYRYGRAA